MFIIGEGMAKRIGTDRAGASVVSERFMATEAFGRKALFACQGHSSTVVAETAVLAYEFERRALARLLAETPELLETFAMALAQLHYRETHPGRAEDDLPAAAIARLVHLHRGQIEANYGGQLALSHSAA
jgi:CRP-like cAMP-binding protein